MALGQTSAKQSKHPVDQGPSYAVDDVGLSVRIRKAAVELTITSSGADDGCPMVEVGF